MKIVNRTAFLALPAGTVFAKYQPCVFGELMIKDDSIFFETGNDFLYQAIVDAIDCDGSEEFTEKCDAAARGESVSFDFDCLGRDGFFDYDELYAVWEPADVAQLIDRLNEAIQPWREATDGVPLGTRLSVDGWDVMVVGNSFFPMQGRRTLEISAAKGQTIFQHTYQIDGWRESLRADLARIRDHIES